MPIDYKSILAHSAKHTDGNAIHFTKMIDNPFQFTLQLQVAPYSVWLQLKFINLQSVDTEFP